MSRTARTLRLILQCSRMPAVFHVAALGLACAAAHVALPAAAAEAEAPQPQRAQLIVNTCAKPQYPQSDLQARHEGVVTVGFLVDATGRVQDSKVAQSSGFASLDEAARTSLANCSFQPALEHGKPVQQWTMVRYVWTLH